MELLFQTVYKLRMQYQFHGYIHLKAIPGAPSELIERAGYYVDRMSINVEFPTAEGLRTLAPHKSRKTILAPMRQIQTRAYENKQELALYRHTPQFVPAGQSTQMIIGATGENDYQILNTAESLYQKFELKRVFYSAFVNVNEDTSLPMLPQGPPLLREHRLYQADWLLRFYGFQAGELLSQERPNFNMMIDPKCDWALRHLELFPVEINRADYSELLKVPGIGVKSAMRIVNSRRTSCLTFEHLKKIGVVLKRAKYFITCSGKMMYRIPVEEAFITRQLIGEDRRKSWELEHPDACRQLSLFDDFHIERNG